MYVPHIISGIKSFCRGNTVEGQRNLTLTMFPAAFSLSVWSSCSEESVSSRVCSSSSEGRRALRYGMELGRAAITGDTVTPIRNHASICVRITDADVWLTWEGSDVIFEEALSLSGLRHEASERSLYVSPLTRRLLSHHLVVWHRLSECLSAERKSHNTHSSVRVSSVTHKREDLC